MVTLTIDGVEVTVERGTSILEAAQKAGIRIPTLCNDKRLIPYGSCRLCIVEVTARGRTRTMPACFNPARDGMQVVTQSEKLTASRRVQLSLLLRSHPLLCPMCDAAGDCQLQNLVHEYEVGELPFSRESRYFHVDNDSNFIRHNMNLCIRCGMCVRICDEVQGVNELSFVNRGMLCEVSTDFGRPLDCEFCGQCASVCPVGAIASKWLVGTGREFELKKTNTTCAFCSLGCTLTLGEKNKKVVYVTSPGESPNEGNLCVKGRYGWPYIFSEKRLTKPLIRKGGALVEVDWNEALSFVAEKLNSIKSASGAASLAALGSERLTNEEAYVFNRFVRTVLETPNLDHAAGYGYRAFVDALAPMMGHPSGTNSVRDLRNAKVLLLLSADLTESHPVAKNEVIQTNVRHRAKPIVVDSIRTKLTERPGAMFLPVPPGTEHLVAFAIIKWIVDQERYDRKALDLVTEGLDELIASVADYTPEKVAEITGLDADLIRNAAKEYVDAPTATIVITQGMNKNGNSVELAKAAVNLALLTGRIGKEGCGVHVFGEKANAQGAVDMGLGPDLLPGSVSVEDEAARKKFETAWDSPIPAGKGLDAQAILEGARSGQIKAMYVAGENPVETYPDRTGVEKALGNLEFLVVQDMFLTSTAKMAHAVLPVSAFIEKSGTFTSADRRVQLIRPTTKVSVTKGDMEIFGALAALMGKPAMTYAGPQQVMDEIASLVDVYAGISYDRLGDFGLVWPCIDSEDPGKEILYEGGFPGKKAKFSTAPKLETIPRGDLPLYLIPGVLKFHSGSFSEWSFSLMEVRPEGFAEMNRDDLKTLGIKDGEPIRIITEDGSFVRLTAKVTRRALPGTVIVPQHFSAVKLNSLTRWNKAAVKVKIEKV